MRLHGFYSIIQDILSGCQDKWRDWPDKPAEYGKGRWRRLPSFYHNIVLLVSRSSEEPHAFPFPANSEIQTFNLRTVLLLSKSILRY